MAEFFKPQIIEFLTQAPINFAEQDQDHYKIVKVFPKAELNFYKKIVIDIRKSMILIYSFDKFNPLTSGAEKRAAVDFVCEANQLIEIGSLEVREDKGIMHYRISQLLPGVSDIREVFKYMLSQSDKIFQSAREAIKIIKSVLSQYPSESIETGAIIEATSQAVLNFRQQLMHIR